MIDLDLVQQAKLDSKSMVRLFKKYEGLIYKRYRAFQRRNTHLGYEYEDFKSEAFLILSKVVQTFNVDKINNDRFTFTSYFARALNWKIGLYHEAKDKKFSHVSYESDFNPPHGMEDVPSMLEGLGAVTEDSSFSLLYSKDFVERILTRLSDQEKKVVHYILNGNNKRKVLTLEGIGNAMGVSKQRVSIIVQGIRNKWQNLTKEDQVC